MDKREIENRKKDINLIRTKDTELHGLARAIAMHCYSLCVLIGFNIGQVVDCIAVFLMVQTVLYSGSSRT